MRWGCCYTLSQTLKVWMLPPLPLGGTPTSLHELWWVLLPSPTSTVEFTFLPSPQTRGNLRSSSSMFL